MTKWAFLLAAIVITAVIATTALQARSRPAFGEYFNGSAYIQLNASVTGNFTVVTWVNYAHANTLGVIVSGGVGNNQHSGWYLGDGGEITNKTACGIFSNERVGNYTAGWRFAAINQLEPGKWYQLACVYNGSSVALYVDGKLANATQTPYRMLNTSIIQIGKRTSTFYLNRSVPTFAYFNGYIANLQVYPLALTQNEIMELYEDGIKSKPLSRTLVYALNS
ncbi:MAG: LamG domain-containing protein [Candidatus Micrarchaeia archaeon]